MTRTDSKLAMAFGANALTTRLELCELTLEECGALFSDFRIGDKDGRFFIPAKFREPERKAGHIATWSAAVLDLDEEREDWPAIIRERLEGLAYCAHTTHTPGRWRVFVPYSQPVSPERHRALCVELNALFPGADRCNVSKMQFFYLPSHVPGAAPEAFNTLAEGQLLHPGQDLEAQTKRAPAGLALDPLNLHTSALSAVGAMVAEGARAEEVYAAFTSQRPAIEAARGVDRVGELLDKGELSRIIDHCMVEEGKKAEPWPDPVDPFTEFLVPSFPLDALPEAMQAYCLEQSRASGFDAGGYAFALLIAAANTIDQRSRLQAGGSFDIPPMLWGALEGSSGAGKSPVMKAAMKFPQAIESKLLKESRAALAAWNGLSKQKQRKTPKPPFKQRILSDTTTEALAIAANDNPEGLFLSIDEMTEFLGRMDAYSGRDGGKDRGVFLKAFDGSQVTINRVMKGAPMVVDQLSLGILTGVQPQVLAAKFGQRHVASDGLYQRFLFYVLGDAGPADFRSEANAFSAANLAMLFEGLGELGPVTTRMSEDALAEFQSYTNQVRTISARTRSERFAEHLSKFPGFLGRIALALHFLAARGCLSACKAPVSLRTLSDAKRIMAALYRHSEAVYEVLDRASGATRSLTQSAMDAILAKEWQGFSIGHLTRDATHWEGNMDRRDREAALDLLIELGWIRDITPMKQAGRGRPSAGKFSVNPAVHSKFCAKADRIRIERQERLAAIQAAAAERRAERGN